VAEILEETTGQITDLRATGGFVRSQLWLQILSDVFQKEVHVPVDHNSACLGAALLGLKATGQLTDLDQGLSLLINANSVSPNVQNKDIYRELFSLYKKLYHSNVEHFATITRFQRGLL
jgi:gluconokinase